MLTSTPTPTRAERPYFNSPAKLIRSEPLFDLQEAASRFPRGERWQSVSIKSLMRWLIGGKRKIKLEGVRISGRWYTSDAAIARFIQALEAKH